MPAFKGSGVAAALQTKGLRCKLRLHRTKAVVQAGWEQLPSFTLIIEETRRGNLNHDFSLRIPLSRIDAIQEK
jgi:hypothetical protein